MFNIVNKFNCFYKYHHFDDGGCLNNIRISFEILNVRTPPATTRIPTIILYLIIMI